MDLSLFQFTRENIEKLFGHEAAEREQINRLQEYFIRRNDYETIKSDLPLKIVVGFKGVGKSALLKMSYLEDIKDGIPALWIRPDDVSELYEDILKETNFLRLVTLWKKGLARLIACRITEDWICVVRDEAETAIQWAEQAGYRSKDLIGQIVSKLKPLINKYVDTAQEPRQSIAEHRMLGRLIKDRAIRIYIDDLDRGWKASSEDTRRLSALINALGDLTTDIDGLQVRISLRTDVFALIRESDESTDKFESSVLPCSWTNHEILIALVKRIRTFFEKGFDEDKLKDMSQAQIAEWLSPLFAPRMEGTLCWNDAPTYRVIMSLIRRRPRDMVKLCTNAAQCAYNNKYNVITSKNIVEVLENYSSERITDIINEFSSEMSTIKDLLYNMGPTVKELREKKIDRYMYSTDQLYKKIKNLINSFPITFTYKTNPDIHDIAHFLFKIGYITARKDLPNGRIDRLYYEDKKQLLLRHIGDLGYMWEIHPAYRGALARGRKEVWESTVNIKEID
ncbi:MAG: P-loop ATPase, Sll1717 family [Eubacteriales bacterium]